MWRLDIHVRLATRKAHKSHVHGHAHGMGTAVAEPRKRSMAKISMLKLNSG